MSARACNRDARCASFAVCGSDVPRPDGQVHLVLPVLGRHLHFEVRALEDQVNPGRDAPVRRNTRAQAPDRMPRFVSIRTAGRPAEHDVTAKMAPVDTTSETALMFCMMSCLSTPSITRDRMLARLAAPPN